MFNSSKSSESSRNLKSNQQKFNDETINETSNSFALPKITSTPRNSIFATPPRPLILKTRRYSLSEVATPPRSLRREFLRSNSSQGLPGPLLASTKYNINVSTFEDVKSPGLANRIVQYHEEAEREKEQRRPPTHQAKYGALGLFPVVHLFKKKLPLLERRPRHVTVRVASPDYIKHVPDYNRRLLEGIVKPGGTNHVGLSLSSLPENSTSTRSVLDALKEISRKRIHANEELEFRSDSNKRLRTESEDCPDSNKRGRDESPLLETTSPTGQVSKKICKYDEYAASRSSMDFLKKTAFIVPKRKSIDTSTITDDSKEPKHIKLINAETQTIPEEEPNKKETETATKALVQEDKPEQIETVVKVFDDAPLERIRKNRLAALMGTLVGKDAVLESKPEFSSLLQDETDKPINDELDRPLVSILTPKDKSPNKTIKHVHFDIPPSTETLISTPLSTRNPMTDTLEQKRFENPPSTDSSPKGTISVPSFLLGNKPTPEVSAAKTSDAASTPPTLISPFSAKPAIETASDSSATMPVIPTLPISSPPKAGGFKFDLSKPAAPLTTPTPKPTFGFAVPSTVNSVPTFGASLSTASVQSSKKETSQTIKDSSPSGKTTRPSDATSKPSFSFGAISSAPSSTAFNFGGAKTVPPTSTSIGLFGSNSSASPGFGTVSTSAKTSFSTTTSVANKGLITSPSVTSGTSSVLSAFGTGVTSVNSTFNAPTFGTGNTSNIPSFVSVNTTPSTIPNTANKANVPSFGNVSTSSPTFGNLNTTNVGTFGKTNTTSAPSFALGTNPSTGGFGASSGFGIPTAPGLNPTTAPVNTGFGTPTTVSSGFGTAATPGFGTTNNIFAPSATPPNVNFGGTPKTSTLPTLPAFASNGGFGTSAAPAPGFGTSAAPATGFGTSATTGGGFDTTTTPAAGFGASAPTGGGFGTSTTSTSRFGTPATAAGAVFGTPSTANAGFGAGSFSTTNASTFGPPTTSVFAFGGANTAQTASTFGGANTAQTASTFGGANTARTASTFGGTNTAQVASTFGVTNAASPTTFGAPTTTANSGFGTTNSGFGATSGSLFGSTNAPSFGGSSSTPSFGSTSSGSSFQDAPFGAPTTNSSVFGAAATTTAQSFGGANSSFGPPVTTSSIFGSTQSPFATTNASTAIPFTFAAKPTTAGSFGTTNTTTASFGMGFAQNTTVGFGGQPPPSNFGTTNKAPAFGGSNPPAFGAASTASGFGAAQQPQQPFGTAGSVLNKPQPPPQSAFGSAQFSFNQQQQQPNNAANFGAPANQTGVFTFGAPEKSGAFNFNGAPSGETPKKFDFTGGNVAAPAFGASFGNATNPAVPGFPAAPAVAGGFSIGSGPPTSNRPRPMIKGKRRT